jgi:hypothetical protein
MLTVMLDTTGIVPSPDLEFGETEGEDFEVFERR